MTFDIDNLWDDALDNNELTTTDRVVELMGDCAKSLGKRTNGKVRGRFIRAKQLAGAGVAVAEMSKILAAFPVEDDDLSDANDLYSSKRYAFDIISDTYRFRLFSVLLRPVYPIDLAFDEGVLKEMGEDSFCPQYGSKGTGTVRVCGDDDLMTAFTNAVSTRKVRYLLRRLCEENIETDD